MPIRTVSPCGLAHSCWGVYLTSSGYTGGLPNRFQFVLRSFAGRSRAYSANAPGFGSRRASVTRRDKRPQGGDIDLGLLLHRRRRAGAPANGVQHAAGDVQRRRQRPWVADDEEHVWRAQQAAIDLHTAVAVEEVRRGDHSNTRDRHCFGATGAGIVLTITDPQASVRSDVLLDTMEELRDAGAEAMSVSGVRVVTSTYFLDRDSGVEVDGRLLRPPYVFLVIGDPRTLAAALDIPGGVLDTVRRRPGASAAVEQQLQVDVTALRALVTPRYARPAAAESGSIG